MCAVWKLTDQNSYDFLLRLVYFASVSDAKDEYCYKPILDFTNDTPVTHSILPELSKFGTQQSLANGTGIIQFCNSFIQEIKDTSGNLFIKAVYFPHCCGV
jgi:hypothetical protein